MLSSQVQEERRFLTKKSDKIYQCVDVLICQCDNSAKIKIISQLANVSITHWLIKWLKKILFYCGVLYVYLAIFQAPLSLRNTKVSR